MEQANQANPDTRDSRAQPVHVTAIALRGIGQVYDMQLGAARMLLQTQARAAAAFGWPDCSDLFDSADERSRRAFSAGAEQVMKMTRSANQAVSELQRQVGRVAETQAANAAEQWQRGLEELGAHTEEGMAQLSETAREQAEQALQASHALAESARETLRQGGEQLREGMREGAERSREATAEMADAAAGQVEPQAPAQEAAASTEERSGRRSRVAA